MVLSNLIINEHSVPHEGLKGCTYITLTHLNTIYKHNLHGYRNNIRCLHKNRILPWLLKKTYSSYLYPFDIPYPEVIGNRLIRSLINVNRIRECITIKFTIKLNIALLLNYWSLLLKHNFARIDTETKTCFYTNVMVRFGTCLERYGSLCERNGSFCFLHGTARFLHSTIC